MARWAGPRTHLNFTLDPADARGIYPPATYAGLAQVKGRYDAGDMFRASPQIRPAPPLARAA